MLTCWRGFAELVPVPAAAASRVNGMKPKSLRNASSGSLESNEIGAASPLENELAGRGAQRG